MRENSSALPAAGSVVEMTDFRFGLDGGPAELLLGVNGRSNDVTDGHWGSTPRWDYGHLAATMKLGRPRRVLAVILRTYISCQNEQIVNV